LPYDAGTIGHLYPFFVPPSILRTYLPVGDDVAALLIIFSYPFWIFGFAGGEVDLCYWLSVLLTSSPLRSPIRSLILTVLFGLPAPSAALLG